MLILGVESSCDETGVALYDSATGILTHRLHSQVDMHRAYGGVVPELASRDHIRRVVPLTEMVLEESGRSLHEIDAVAVTQGPGLGGALLVGTSFAAALGAALNKPVIGIHHLEGHLLSPLLADPRPDFPFVALLVSGGHTQLMAVHSVGKYQLLGETLDDAAGEAFDKTASLLGLGYPGGPALAQLAEPGVDTAFKLPRPMLHSGDLEFSFSGLKTAVLTQKQKLVDAGSYEQERANLAASFEAAIVDVLISKSIAALKQTRMDQIVVAGGVGANRKLRERLVDALRPFNAKAYFPPLALCTDNGAMIAFAAGLRLQNGLQNGLLGSQNCFVDGRFTVKPRWPLDGLSQ